MYLGRRWSADRNARGGLAGYGGGDGGGFRHAELPPRLIRIKFTDQFNLLIINNLQITPIPMDVFL